MNKDRRERRKQAKQQRKADENVEFLNMTDLMTEMPGKPPGAWWKHDEEWFDAHPGCTYHLRKAFPGEYEQHEAPPPHAWLSLVSSDESMTIITPDAGVMTVPLFEKFPVAPQPADGLDRLMSLQATQGGQEALRAVWDDYHQLQGANHG
ncbi:hypothetical protein LVO39_002466 [Salmonella enterica]|nr:hypothetical protein [Salmonella enterica subsp. enterica serovar Florida]EIQ6926256.1 hypothetical protein [Salmonella enterica]ECF4164069.1 hypothetical protein [Salmonella enterica subsp. enterica serovar Florida]ECW2472422.1 hypothetical protein [Salmonella enterica subsp. enterica serovar Florida]EJS1432066.1 hypothetical protein [Salmonella enterica]